MPDTPRRAQDVIVQIRRLWTDEWQSRGDILCDSATVAALPAIGGASLRWDYGRMYEFDSTQLITRQAYTSGLMGWYVRLVTQPFALTEEGEPQPVVVLATGIINNDDDTIGDIDDATTGTGTQMLTMRGIGYALKQKFMRESIVKGSGGGVSTISRCLTFNGREGRGGKIRPNRSTDKATVNGRECYVFAQTEADAEMWTAEDICEYLLVAFGGDALAWELNDLDDRMSLCTPTIRPAATVLDTLSRVIDRRRGMCGLCTVNTAGNGELKVDGVFGEAISAGTVTIPANGDQWSPVTDFDSDVTSVRVRRSLDTRFDTVEAVGRRIWLCGTIEEGSSTEPGSLAEDWSSDAEASYIATAEDERQNRTDLGNVFRRYTHSGQMDLGVCGDDGEVDYEARSPQYLLGRTLDRQVPLTGPAGNESSSDAETARLLPMMAFITNGGKTYDLSTIGDMDLFGRPGNSSVVPLDDRVGVQFRTPYGHLLAGTGSSELVNSQHPPISYSDLRITCAWRSDERLRVRRDVRVVTDSEERVLQINVPDAECWAILPGTTTGIGPDNAEVLQEDEALEVRNDRDFLSAVCAVAASWYSRDRAAVEWTREGLEPDYLPGRFIDTLVAGSRDISVGSVISTVVWNVRAQTTTVVTDFGEMDAAAIVSGASGGGGPGGGADTPLADAVAPPVLAAVAVAAPPALPFPTSTGYILTAVDLDGGGKGWQEGPLTVEDQ